MVTKQNVLGQARFPKWGLRLALILALVLPVLLLGVVWLSWPREAVAETPVSGFAATLHDDVQELPEGRVAWSTEWRLCWAPYPRARGYEVQVVTGEGPSPRLLEQPGTCLDLEVAAGDNRRAEGLRGRDAQLLMQAGQLGYRVRAVLPRGRVSAWSPQLAVGEETP